MYARKSEEPSASGPPSLKLWSPGTPRSTFNSFPTKKKSFAALLQCERLTPKQKRRHPGGWRRVKQFQRRTRSAGRHGLDRFDDAAGDEIRVGSGVRTAILEVALVAIVDEAVRQTHRGAAVGQAVVELVDRLRLVQAREAEVIFRAVNGDVLVAMLVECFHKFLEVGFTADFAHELRRKIRVHTGAVPVEGLAEGGEDGLAAPLDVNPVAFTQTGENVAG